MERGCALTSWDQQEKSKLKALVESLAPIATLGFVITEKKIQIIDQYDEKYSLVYLFLFVKAKSSIIDSFGKSYVTFA